MAVYICSRLFWVPPNLHATPVDATCTAQATHVSPPTQTNNTTQRQSAEQFPALVPASVCLPTTASRRNAPRCNKGDRGNCAFTPLYFYPAEILRTSMRIHCSLSCSIIRIRRLYGHRHSHTMPPWQRCSCRHRASPCEHSMSCWRTSWQA